MKTKRDPVSRIKRLVVLSLVAMHPVLLSLLFPIVGERSNLVIVLAPLASARRVKK
jgi:hypothetical protein